MKRLVVCIDGTWQNMAVTKTITNIAKIARDVKPVSPSGVPQLVYYSPGIGGEAYLGETKDRIIKGAVGGGAEEAIVSAYLFLALNYNEGDQIYLFGFSRGAFCARSLAGLIRACGLVKRNQTERIGAGFSLYRKDPAKHPNLEADRAEFRESYSIEAQVKYVGVFDTVVMRGAVKFTGTSTINRKYGFHDLMLGDHVESARHALAIDERRNSLRPTPWTNLDERNQAVGETDLLNPHAPFQQKWFAGAHGDIGGGQSEQLSMVTRRWIKAGATLKGLVFGEDLRIPHSGEHGDFRSGEVEVLRGLLNIMGLADRVAYPKLTEPSQNRLNWFDGLIRDSIQGMAADFGWGKLVGPPSAKQIEQLVHISALLRVSDRRARANPYMPGTLRILSVDGVVPTLEAITVVGSCER